MNSAGIAIILLIIFIDIFKIFIGCTNHIYINKIPLKEKTGIFTYEELEKSLNYHNMKFYPALINSLISIFIFALLFLGGYIQKYDRFLFENFNTYTHAILIFFGFSFINFLIGLPFDIYDIFFVEKRFGFNKMTILTFLKDVAISSVISVILVCALLSGVLFIIANYETYWVIIASIFVIGFMLFTTYIYPWAIAPLFNKFEPLKDKELEEDIFSLSKKAGFSLKNIFQMDASKRTAHSNAYFTGLGRNKRIVLFDTLLKNHSKDEILAILAHEIGHYKLNHIKIMLSVSIVFIVITFAAANFIVFSSYIYNSLGFAESLPGGLFIVSIIFSPISFIVSPFLMMLYRKHEYEADKFSYNIICNKSALKEALIKLHKHNLSFPYPHLLYVFFKYTHPPLISRLEKL